MSPSGSGIFCWSFFDILRSATLLIGQLPLQPVDIRNEDGPSTAGLSGLKAKKKIELDMKVKA